MTFLKEIADYSLRGGIEVSPEFLDTRLEIPPEIVPRSDDFVEEALLESFPASDAPASGRMT